MNARVAFNQPRAGSDESRRAEAAGGMHAQIACTTSLENAQAAFSTAPTRRVFDMIENNNLLPMSPDKSVT
jgi:hypothetical protein